jgi:hypothetical protein
VQHWRIDTERASARIEFRPGIPGLGITVRGLSGTFDLQLGDDGRPDMDVPITGEFALALADLDMGRDAVTRMSKAWLAGKDEVPIRGTIRNVVRTQGDDHDDFAFTIDVEMKGEAHTTDGVGTSGTVDGVRLPIEGRTTVNPRALGLRLPKFLNIRGDVVWDLALVLVDD